MKRIKLFCVVISIYLLLTPNINYAMAEEVKYYNLGGFPIGIQVFTEGAYVLSLNEVITNDGISCPAKDSGIIEGDLILSINGNKTNDSEDLYSEINNSKGDSIVVELDRDGDKILKDVIPVKDLLGEYRIGLTVKDDLTGIGTVTMVDTQGNFVALGHPIVNNKGKIVQIKGGNIYKCSVYSVIKGERGRAGELKGIFYEEEILGNFTKNKSTGLYGQINNYNFKENKFEIANGKIGKASIFTCIDGEKITEYSINIVKVENNKDNKDYVIKITDKNLLKETNGILQGMSGSPIVQNGKIIGAVTHVFINDPTRGYGISAKKLVS